MQAWLGLSPFADRAKARRSLASPRSIPGPARVAGELRAAEGAALEEIADAVGGQRSGLYGGPCTGSGHLAPTGTVSRPEA